MTQLDVKAKLALDSRGFNSAFATAGSRADALQNKLDRTGKNAEKTGRGLRGASRDARNLQSALFGANGAAGGLFTKLFAMGGAYVGFNLVSRAVSMLTRGTAGYTAELEKAQIGLAGVISGVDGIKFDAAERSAKRVFERIKELSIASPSSPQEMLGIFQGIVGPIRAAGFSMNKVLDLTNKTTLSAASLGVDFAQASRDIGMMVRGTAGMDVKLFSLMRSMGAITESTEEWNQKLTAAERVEKLDKALSKFATPEKARAFENSWVGVSSTFKGIMQEMGRAGMTPVMEQLTRSIGRFNTYLLANRLSLERLLKTYGTEAARKIEQIANALGRAGEFLVNNWDQISARIHSGINTLRQLVPVLKAAALAITIANIVPGGATAIGLAGKMAGASALGFGTSGKVRSIAAIQKDQETGKAQGWKQDRGGRWRDKVGNFVPMGSLSAAGIGGGAGGAAGGITAGGIGMAAGAIAVAVATLGGAFLAAAEHWTEISSVWSTATAGIFTQFETFWLDLQSFAFSAWGAIEPFIKLMGVSMIPIWAPIAAGALAVYGALRAVMQIFHTLQPVISVFTKVLASIADTVWDNVSGALSFLLSLLKDFAVVILNVADALGFAVREVAVTRNFLKKPEREVPIEEWLESRKGHNMRDPYAQLSEELRDYKTPVARGGAVVNNDFRGSRINVNQDFGRDKDPDRILHAMMNDITRQAETRISSGYSSAFTR